MREENTFRIDMPSLLRDLKYNILPMILTALAVLMLVYSYQVFVGDDVYTTVSQFTISNDGSKYINNTSGAQESISLLQEVLNSDVFGRLVEEKIGFTDYQISLSSITNTNMVTMSVKSNTPYKSFVAMKTILEEYPVFVDNLGLGIYTMMLQNPSMPEGITNVDTKTIYLIIGFIAGALVYAYVVVLISITRKTVKNDVDMEEYIQSSLLGVIPFEKRKSKKTHVFSTKFLDEYQICATTVMHQMDRKGYKTLLVGSTLPHEGKTTSVLNLALAMSRGNKRVLVLDGDFKNPSVAQTMQISKKKNNGLFYAIIGVDEEMEEENYYKFPNKEVYCLTLDKSHPAMEKSFSNGTFQQLLKQESEKFDYIIVDSGPVGLVAATELLVGICQASVLLVAQDLATIKAINAVVELFESDGDCIGCIFKEMYQKTKSNKYGYGYGYHYDMYGDE